MDKYALVICQEGTTEMVVVFDEAEGHFRFFTFAANDTGKTIVEALNGARS